MNNFLGDDFEMIVQKPIEVAVYPVIGGSDMDIEMNKKARQRYLRGRATMYGIVVALVMVGYFLFE